MNRTISFPTLFDSTEHQLATDYTVAAGDHCPKELDKSIFTEDQLDYLDAFFTEYHRRAHERSEYLLNTALDHPRSKPITRAINLALIDYTNGEYGEHTSDHMDMSELAKQFKMRKEHAIAHREKIINRHRELLRIEHTTP